MKVVTLMPPAVEVLPPPISIYDMNINAVLSWSAPETAVNPARLIRNVEMPRCTAASTSVNAFGSALNLNTHLHMLLLEGAE